ncbi:stage IV sporulation protein FB [Paenibacillus uliginis N3/975]|uniref:Stage IV sporulation protein FB n=1 Tax=Paenibacillus uliginis N3/975 TaxID=1313296 RepID=A0A1X7HM28_9BACL|nr:MULTISPECIES: M50 family metallopeptidase [Paenibacillus]UNK19845.1 M50 family metallopeptidase [Paenibacillus sp. N3/727]SMF89213.1 stage IV sporulation protein FB [Paenibacillus uliginis N3/975]
MISIRGTVLSLHPLFVIVMLASVITGRFLELLTLFVIVFIHELGHAGAAIAMGFKVRSIQMLPFGGVAVIEDDGRMNAARELIIALAGPLQNGIMIGIAWLCQAAGWGDGPFLSYVIQGNLIIALFNLLPVLPLDGGKVMQALVSLLLPYHATLLWTARAGMICSLFMIGYGLSPLLSGGGIKLNLLLIGLFLAYSNFEDHRNVPYRFMRFLVNRNGLYEHQQESIGTAQPIVADSSKPLDDIMRLFKREKYHLIYVMNRRGGLMAVVPEQHVIASFFASNRPPWYA